MRFHHDADKTEALFPLLFHVVSLSRDLGKVFGCHHSEMAAVTSVY